MLAGGKSVSQSGGLPRPPVSAFCAGFVFCAQVFVPVQFEHGHRVVDRRSARTFSSKGKLIFLIEPRSFASTRDRLELLRTMQSSQREALHSKANWKEQPYSIINIAKMKTALVFSTIVAGCTAFAPSANVARSSSTALAGDLSGEIGAQAPLGFWDPLDMTNGGEKDTFDALREIELKHGRVAMLAVVGTFCRQAGKIIVDELHECNALTWINVEKNDDGHVTSYRQTSAFFLADDC